MPEQRPDKKESAKPSRRVLTRGRILTALGVLFGIPLVLFLLLALFYGTGSVDSYVKSEFVNAFDKMGIGLSAGRFETGVSPLTMHLEDVTFRNKKTNQVLATVRNARFNLSFLDLFALKAQRNISIDSAEIYGLNVFVKFDRNGNSNFEGIEITPPTSRVKFKIESSNVSIRDSSFHFGDEERKISGDARDLVLTLAPLGKKVEGSDLNYEFDLSSTKAQFTYGEKKIEPFSVRGIGQLTELGIGLESLSLITPIGSSTVHGSIDGWKDLKYDLTVVSDIDLTQASRIFPLGTAMSGTGGFRGRIKGAGEKYRIEGEVVSESLAASNVRLKALTVDGTADGKGSTYTAAGKAIAELLTFNEFRLNFPQISGSIRGSGADFKWFGALEAASLKAPLGTVGSLFVNDAVAEYRDNRLLADLKGVRAAKFTSTEAYLEAITTPDIKITDYNDLTTAVVDTANAGRIDAEGATLRNVDINGIEVRSRHNNTEVDTGQVRADSLDTEDASLTNVTANDVRAVNRDGITSIEAGRIAADRAIAAGADLRGIESEAVEIETGRGSSDIKIPRLRIATVESDSAVLADLNIAGVRLTVRQGLVNGYANDFKPGTVDLKGNGRLEEVAVSKPVFVLEPSGRYRASFDLTLGGGLLGSIDLGAARAAVVADSDKVVLSDLNAEVMDGRLEGAAVLAMKDTARSELKANFTGLDVAKLIALQSGKVLPVRGDASGNADLNFAGRNGRRASGSVEATVSATAGDAKRGFLPISGRLSLKANDGLITFENAKLTSGKTDFAATGKLDLFENDSDLGLSIDSSDASEIDRVIRVFEIVPQLREQLDTYDARLAGNFKFRGNLTGNAIDPSLTGKGELDSLYSGNRNLGSLAASFRIDPQMTEISEGQLREPSGGKMTFDVKIPAAGENNTEVRAGLEDFNIGTLLTAIPLKSVPDYLRDLQAKTTGQLDLTGLPDKMEGSATLSASEGSLNGQTFDSLRTMASFDGMLVNIEEFEATFGKGNLTANGFYRTDIRTFIVQAKGRGVPAGRVIAFLPQDASIPKTEGTIDIDLTAQGSVDDTSTYDIDFEGHGDNVIVSGNSFGDVNFTGKTSDRKLSARLSIGSGAGSQTFEATADLGRDEVPFRAETVLDKTQLRPYFEIFRNPGKDGVVLGGTASGKIAIAGNLVVPDKNGDPVFGTSDLRGTASLGQFQLLIGETPVVASEPVEISFDLNQVTVKDARFSGGGTNLTVNGTKALTSTGVNNLSLRGRMDLRVLNALSKDQFFAGLADVEMTLTGPNSTARLNGRATLERGAFSTFIGSERVSLEGLTGCVLFNSTQVRIGCNDTSGNGDRIVGRLGTGRVSLTGEAVLTKDLLLEGLRLDVSGRNVSAPFPVGFNTVGNADISITGRRTDEGFGSIISGNFFARRSLYTKDIDIADFVSGRREATLSTSSDSPAFLADTRLDIRVIGRDALVIRNNIADLTGSADLRVTGSIENPQISGRIIANEGTVFFRDDRYELQRGTLTFPPSSSIEPVINLSAVSEIAGYQVFVNLSGNLSDPDSFSATTRSNPALPQADVVSLITTGSLANTGAGIPTFAQSGLNTAAEILTDEIINKPVTRATDKLFGLNRFTLDPIISGTRGNPTARLTVGRQINRNLLVTYSTNLSEDQNQVVALEYRVSNRLSFVAQYEQRSISNITRQRNAFSFEIRLRKRF